MSWARRTRPTRHTGVRRHLNAVTLGGLLLAAVTAAPLLWMALTSLKSPVEAGASPPTPIPENPTLDTYHDALVTADMGRYLLNSAVVCVSSTAVVLALALFAGYALARLPMRGRAPVMVALLMISVFPVIAVVTPLYLLERQLGLLNSYPGLIVPYVAFHLPFAIWLLRNSLLDIPAELEEQATIDGATATRTLRSVILPQAGPALFTAGVFTFTACWTEFLMALTLNSENDLRTIPVGIALFGDRYEVPYGTIFAAAMAATLPIALLVLVFRRTVLSGLTDGAVKG